MKEQPPSPTPFSRGLPDGISVGSPIADFTFSWKRRAFWAALGVGSVIGGIVLVALAWFDEDRFPGPSTRSKAIAGGFLAASCGAILLFNALRIRRLHAWVGTTGVALLENDNVQSAGWAEIVTLWDSKITSANSVGVRPMLLATVRGEDRMVTAHCHDGKRLVFKSFLGDIGRLAKIIKRETLGHQFPTAAALLDAEGAVQFGPLALRSEGMIQKDGNMLPWSEAKDVVNKDGVFKILMVGKWLSWFSCSQSEIPNLHVLMFLIDKYRNPEEKTPGRL